MNAIKTNDCLPRDTSEVGPEARHCPACGSTGLQVVQTRQIPYSPWSDQDLRCACGFTGTFMVYMPEGEG